MDSKDIIIAAVGAIISFYGGFTNNLYALGGGILVVILSIYLAMQEQEEDIKILKAQINTKDELNRIWRVIEEIKNDLRKKR